MVGLTDVEVAEHIKSLDAPFFLDEKLFTLVRYIEQETVPGGEDFELEDVDGNKRVSNVDDTVCLGDGLSHTMVLTDGKVIDGVSAVWNSDIDKEMVVVGIDDEEFFLLNKRKVKNVGDSEII
ncbi:hypothetical protein MOD96_01245 [Bacillus sp. S17B2]|uniref:hypothetical protein n=1 Tax=Bacillus sp. S17B2 TaxID=2918907 RepID=UPI0022814A57|nr:hypothetical protein [Bacillus sp. S17B2]